MARNFPAQANSTFSSKSQPSAHQESGTSPQQDDDELCDPEDAESCDDLDDLFRPSTDTLAAPCNADIKWDYVCTYSLIQVCYATHVLLNAQQHMLMDVT